MSECPGALCLSPGRLVVCLIRSGDVLPLFAVCVCPFDLVGGPGWVFVAVFAACNAINVIFGCKLNVFISVYQLIFIFIYGRPKPSLARWFFSAGA